MSALSAVIRKSPGALFREYLLFREIELPGDFDWDLTDAKLAAPLIGAIEDLHETQHDCVVSDVERVHALANEPGQAAIYSVAHDPELLDDLANPATRALWMLVHQPDRFRHAEEVAFTDDRRRGSMWTGRLTEAGHEMLRDDDAKGSFIEAVKATSGKGRVQVDIFDRVRRTFDGHEFNLVQVAIYREGRSDDHLQFDEDGMLARQPFRPVLEAAATYEPATGSLEVVAGDKDTRNQILEAAVTHLLRKEFSEEEMPLRCYDLSVLLRPHEFATDAEDGIEAVEVRELRLMPIDDNVRRVTLEQMARGKDSIWAMADDLFEDRTPLRGGFVVTRAKLSVKLARRPGRGRTTTLNLTISSPHGCDLRDRTLPEQMIGEKYLRRWGILVDDVRLLERVQD